MEENISQLLTNKYSRSYNYSVLSADDSFLPFRVFSPEGHVEDPIVSASAYISRSTLSKRCDPACTTRIYARMYNVRVATWSGAARRGAEGSFYGLTQAGTRAKRAIR